MWLGISKAVEVWVQEIADIEPGANLHGYEIRRGQQVGGTCQCPRHVERMASEGGS